MVDATQHLLVIRFCCAHCLVSHVDEYRSVRDSQGFFTGLPPPRGPPLRFIARPLSEPGTYPLLATLVAPFGDHVISDLEAYRQRRAGNFFYAVDLEFRRMHPGDWPQPALDLLEKRLSASNYARGKPPSRNVDAKRGGFNRGGQPLRRR